MCPDFPPVAAGVSQPPQTWWSDEDNEIDLPAAAADTNLPDIVIAGMLDTPAIVKLTIKMRALENTNGGGNNAIQGAQNIRIKKSTGAWGVDDIAAINLVDNMWLIAASTREMGDVVVGDIDLSAVVDEDETYNVRFENADVDLDFLRLNDVQVGLEVTY